MAKAKKRAKDLDPKAKAKKVKGGYTSLGTHAGRTGKHVGTSVESVGDAINETGKAFNRAMNPNP